MHAVKNISKGGRTILVTIHQPSIGQSCIPCILLILSLACSHSDSNGERSPCPDDHALTVLGHVAAEIFEAFDAMVLLQAGGRVIP